MSDDWVLDLLDAIGWEISKTAKDPMKAYAAIHVPILIIKKDIKGIVDFISKLF